MKKQTVLVSAMLCAAASFGANPFLPLWEYIPDGEPHVFDDPDEPGHRRVYLYGSHDVRLTEYCGRDQVVWSAPVEDLSNWRFDGVIFRSLVDAEGRPLSKDGLGDVLFAPDVAVTTEENGTKTYWLYPNNQSAGRHSMVAKSSRPDGPFTVCNWSAADSTRTEGVMGFDPAVFVDDDGRVYGYWGGANPCCAELDPATMATVRPGTSVREHHIGSRTEEGEYRFFEASSMRKIQDKYVFIYSRCTKKGEFGLQGSNYTLAYAYGDAPLGPFTYGGTLIDGRARETRPDGRTVATATPNGNTHGSLCEINGRWWLFYHRQCGRHEFSRQAMVAPVTVEVEPGPGGKVTISEAEYTSEGFETEGLDPTKPHAAGIACHYTGPWPAFERYPFFEFSGPYPEPHRCDGYVWKDPYDPGANICRMTHITDGSTIGYRYFNFDRLAGTGKVALSVTLKTYGVAASVDVWLKRPDAETGGLKVGTFALPCCRKLDEFHEETVFLDVLSDCRGKQAVYFTFSSPVKQTPLCEIESFVFRRLPEIAFHGVSDFRDEVPARRGGFKAPPVGWMTWYALWFGTTEEKVLRNARDFVSAFGDVLVEKPVLWIDWEWFHPQLWPGGSIEGEDSLTPRTKLYPRGLRPVADDLKSMGFVPGLWVSVVSDVKTNALWAAHPEWLLPPSNEWCGPVWGDPTAPGFCEEYVPKVFDTYRSWGYEAFKWDTIPHAITVFDRSKGSMDDMFCQSRAAVRRMVEAGRKAVGDAYLLSCSGETDAAVEACPDLFSAARVGADVSKWDEFVKEGVDRFLKYADLHAKTLWCDMDNLVLRAEYSNLAQARTRVSLYSLFGVPLTLGDEISALDRPRIDMLRKVLPTFNVRPVSVGRRVPGEVFRSQVDFVRSDSRWTLHAFTNFETGRTLKTVFRCGDAQVTDFWTGERRIPSDGALRLAIAPCDTVLLRVDGKDSK